MSASTIEAACLLALMAASGCRFGGPSGDPSLPVGDASEPREAAPDVAPAAREGGREVGPPEAVLDANDARDEPPPDVFPPSDAGAEFDVFPPSDDAESDAGAESDADASGDAAPDDAAPTDGSANDASACVPPFSSAICDPVCNTNCAPLLRCNVSEAPATGVCMGAWIAGEAEPCLRTATTDTCAIKLSCVAGMCRRLCYDDDDCTVGTCCTTEINLDGGPSGYKMCTTCGPGLPPESKHVSLCDDA